MAFAGTAAITELWSKCKSWFGRSISASSTATTASLQLKNNTGDNLGSAATIDSATTTAAGVMSADDKTKLNGIATGATANAASTTTPKMDGTAAVGSETAYAKGDHVHPTDTSRAASSHAHGNITNGGDITATAPTVASGDKLVINDESASKITNGPSFGTSTTTYLRNDGTWGTPAGTATQNAFSNVKVGNITIAADTETDTLELVAGSNVTLTPDATNDKLTIAATDTTYSIFTGATGSASGSDGLVPAPFADEYNKVLTGDGHWNNISQILDHAVDSAAGLLAMSGGVVEVSSNHASSSDTYGKGTSSSYGHLKLSDSTSSTTAAASGGTAATPKAVKDALDAAKTYADGLIAGGAAFKGTLGTSGADYTQAQLEASSYKAGWYWVCKTTGTFVGQTCEVGDMVYAIEDKSSSYSASDFTAVQNNLVEMTTAEVDAICV